MIRDTSEFERTKFSWTPDRVKLLEQLRTAGKSAQLIADEIGTSRGSVIGKLDRMGLLSVPVTEARVWGVNRSVVRVVPDPQPPKGTPAPGIASKALALAQAADGCRYGYGDPKHDNFRFCCEPKREGSSYCDPHHARCNVPVQPARFRTAADGETPIFFQRGWDNR